MCDKYKLWATDLVAGSGLQLHAEVALTDPLRGLGEADQRSGEAVGEHEGREHGQLREGCVQAPATVPFCSHVRGQRAAEY